MSEPAPLMVATRWEHNGHLIADVFKAGWLNDDMRILDPTYGEGVWWSVHRPPKLEIQRRTPESPFDFRRTLWKTGLFNAAAYDPPYVSRGGRGATSARAMNDRYGLHDAPATPALLQELINDGFTEMVRVVEEGGIVLVKCQSYVSSGKIWPGEMLTWQHAMSLGCKLEERYIHVRDPRMQPVGRRQVHALQNTSYLFVFRTPRTRRHSVKAMHVEEVLR